MDPETLRDLIRTIDLLGRACKEGEWIKDLTDMHISAKETDEPELRRRAYLLYKTVQAAQEFSEYVKYGEVQ